MSKLWVAPLFSNSCFFLNNFFFNFWVGFQLCHVCSYFLVSDFFFGQVYLMDNDGNKYCCEEGYMMLSVKIFVWSCVVWMALMASSIAHNFNFRIFG